MESTSDQRSWDTALSRLAAWHSRQDRAAADLALSFLEVEFRLCIPPAARRRWPTEQVEDTLQGFLLRLLQKPLPDVAIQNPKAYLQRSFRNWCIDIERGRKRQHSQPWEEIQPQVVQDAPESRQEVETVTAAMNHLSIEDRVSLKMTDAPEMLTWEELAWLAQRNNLAATEVRERVLACPEVYELSLLFDPGPIPKDSKDRRDRMERFRKRRERARQRLKAQLGGGE